MISINLQEALSDVSACLEAHTEGARLDAQVLLAHICGKSRTWVLAHPEYDLSPEEQVQLDIAIDRLTSGTPLPYVLGIWEFYGRSFIVTPATLIPRPETELLVETALAWLQANPRRRQAADVGTGSGCIGVSLAAHIDDLKVTATEISPRAVITAIDNSIRHNVDERVSVIQNDLLSGIPGPFDLICANLPYIPSESLQSLAVYGREPSLALDGGPDGLDLIRRLLKQAGQRLSPGGLILLEIDAGQGESAPAAARMNFPEAEISLKRDLAGHPRLVVIQTI